MAADPDFLLDGPNQCLPSTHRHWRTGCRAAWDSPSPRLLRKTARHKRRDFGCSIQYQSMTVRLVTVKAKPPDSGRQLLRKALLNATRSSGNQWGGLVIGGKSMAEDLASLDARKHGVAGLSLSGYPCHPVGTPGQDARAST